MKNGLRVSPVPCRPPVCTSARLTKSPEMPRTRRSCTPIETTRGSVMPKMPSSSSGISRNMRPMPPASISPMRAVTATRVPRAIGLAGAEVLPGDGRRGAHQAH